MEEASEIFSEINKIGLNPEKRAALREYCTENIEQILKHLPQRILKNDGGYLLEYIFFGLQDKLISKVVDTVLQKVQREPMSITHCDDIISRVCFVLPNLPVQDLVRWSNDSVQSVVDDSDVNMIWKDILPKCLYTITSHDSIQHCGTEMTGEEFKIQCVHTLCQCCWKGRQLVQLASMFQEIQLSQADLKKVVNKLCTYIVDLPPDALPPLVHQLLKLCKVDNMEVVISHLCNYFNMKIYPTLEPQQQDSEATTIDIDDIVQHSAKELSQCLSTCLYHFAQGPIDTDIIRKKIKKWPKTQLLRSPFLIDLALAVSNPGTRVKRTCLDVIKSAIEFHVLDGIRRKESAWVRCSQSPDVDVAALLKIVINESTNHRQFTVRGLIKLAFSLLSVSQAKQTAQACWSHGKLILVRLSSAQPETTGHILSELADRLLGTPQQQYADCLHVLCKLSPVSVERCPQLSVILETCNPVGGFAVATETYAAVRPLITFSTRIRDCLVMVCRKGLYSRESSYRCLALFGFLTLLKEIKLSKGSLSRSQSSEQFSSNSYLTQLTVDFYAINQGTATTTSRMRNESLCFEVISILKRCLIQDAAVRKFLYKEFYECTKDKVPLHESILDMLYEQLFKYLPDEDNQASLLLDKCVQSTETNAILVEPIGYLLYAIAQFLQPVQDEDPEDASQSSSSGASAPYLRNKLIHIMEQFYTSNLLRTVDMEAPFIWDLTPKSRVRYLKMQQLMQCIEAFIAHRIMQWNEHDSDASSVYHMYRSYSQLMEITKFVPKAGRKHKLVNETGEGRSQPEQTDKMKGKGKGRLKGNPAVTVASLAKDKAAFFKPLPCLWDLQTCLRVLDLLYSENVLWSSVLQLNEIRVKRDFHLFALGCVQSALPENMNKETFSTDVLSIAALLYKRCICRFEEMSDFDENITYACLELFKYCTTSLFSTKYSLKTESVLKGITGTSDVPESECLTEIIDNLHKAFQKLEADGAEEDLDGIGKKTLSMLVQITTLLLETPVPACDALNKMTAKLEDYLRCSKQLEALPLLAPLLTAVQREQQEAMLLVEVLTDLTRALGVIDDEGSQADLQSNFPSINSSSGHTALSLVCTHLSSRLKCLEHLLNRARDRTEAMGIGVPTHQQQLEREHKEIYKSLVLQMCQLTSWTHTAAKLRCNVGSDSDRVIGICVRMFSSLASLIKSLDSKMQSFLRPELERLLKLAGKKLASATDDLIMYVVEASGQGVTASALLRRTKLGPRLVLEKEKFRKQVILLGHKVGVNFQQYLIEGRSRDFKIKTQHLQVLQDNSDDEEDNDDEDEVNVSINDAETVVLSPLRSDQEIEYGDESDEESSSTKRSRIS